VHRHSTKTPDAVKIFTFSHVYFRWTSRYYKHDPGSGYGLFTGGAQIPADTNIAGSSSFVIGSLFFKGLSSVDRRFPRFRQYGPMIAMA
jgi:hypothetical protein